MKTTKNDNFKREHARAIRAAEFNQFVQRLAYHLTTRGKFTADDIDEIKRWISDGICYKHNGKMTGNMSFSTCCIDNWFCTARAKNPDCICAHCYAENMQKMYHDQRLKNQRNFELFTMFKLPAAAMPFINAAIFRFESFGDLANKTQLINYFTLCNANSRTTFTIWTKNWFIVRDVINAGYKKPKNLIIICSSPFLNKPARDLFKKYNWIDKIFTVYSLDHMLNAGMSLKDIDKFINCGGRKCIDCQRCYNLTNKQKEVNELLKADQNRFDNMLKKAGLK